MISSNKIIYHLAVTMLAGDVCAHFAYELENESNTLPLYLYACKAAMKQEFGKVVGWDCVVGDGETICEFEIQP